MESINQTTNQPVSDTTDQSINQSSVKRPNTKPKPKSAPLVWRKRHSLIYQPPLYNPLYFNLTPKQSISQSNVRPVSHACVKPPMSYDHSTSSRNTAPLCHSSSSQSFSTVQSSNPIINKPAIIDDDWDEWNDESCDLFTVSGPVLSHSQTKSSNQSINKSQNRRKPQSNIRPKQRAPTYSYPSTEVIKEMSNNAINTLFNHSKLASFDVYIADLAPWSSLFWSTLGSPDSITTNQLAELRLLALQSSLCAPLHGRLSLKSLALVAHLDSIEDSSDHAHIQSINQSVNQPSSPVHHNITLPVFHRCLVLWAALAQNVTITHLNVEAASAWLSSLHSELLSNDSPSHSQSVNQSISNQSRSQRPTFKPLSDESIAALNAMLSEATRQWQRATHSLTSNHTNNQSTTSSTQPNTSTQQSINNQSILSTNLASVPRPNQSVAAALNNIDERKEMMTQILHASSSSPTQSINQSIPSALQSLQSIHSPLHSVSSSFPSYQSPYQAIQSNQSIQSSLQSIPSRDPQSMKPQRRYPSSSDVLELAREQVNQSELKSSLSINKSTNHLLRSSINKSPSPSLTHSQYSRPIQKNSLSINQSVSTSSIIDMLQSLDAQHAANNSRGRRR